ncbi:MAG: peptidyl-prolyl cis-trans isomerase SurA [Pyrinomonadaceae bacterium]|nr:peptidyl-prolyl cis-trans isomerase SurA [Pyrinomonadaceae bacterium]
MRSKFISLATTGLFALALLASAPARAHAQESELQVVDEVIAQVNDDVITLSMLKRESKERIDSLKQSGMPQAEAEAEVAKRQSELIATLVNEMLLLQKGKELDMSSEVEAEVNRRMLDVAKEQGIPTIEKLDAAMRESGVDPVATRQTLRTEIMKQMVIQQEVDRKLFLGPTIDELQKYFQAHQDKFRKPESVTISELFLSSAGKNEAEVKARALELVRQLRAGADFAAIAAANSEREVNGVRTGPQNKGRVGVFELPSLREDIAKAIQDVKAGGVSEPLRSNDGYQIFRVDERTPASNAVTFNENKVREAITIENSDKQRDEYLQGLRNEAYIKIAESYRTSVAPLLKLTPEKVADSSTSSAPEKPEKKKGKFLGIIPRP